MNRKRHKLMHTSIVRRTEVHHGPNGNAYVTTVSAALMKTDAGQRTRLVAVGYGEDISEAVTNMVFEHRLNRLSAQYHSRTKQLSDQMEQMPDWFQDRVAAALDAIQDSSREERASDERLVQLLLQYKQDHSDQES